MSGTDVLQAVVGFLGAVSGAGLLAASEVAFRCRDYSAGFLMVLFGVGGVVAGVWLFLAAIA